MPSILTCLKRKQEDLTGSLHSHPPYSEATIMFRLSSVLIVEALAACRIPSVLAESESSKPVPFHQAGSRTTLF